MKFKTKFEIGDKFLFQVRDYFDGTPNKSTRDIQAKIRSIEITHTGRFTDTLYSLGYEWNGGYRPVGRYSEEQLMNMRDPTEHD
jgi:hypothetical protein